VLIMTMSKLTFMAVFLLVVCTIHATPPVEELSEDLDEFMQKIQTHRMFTYHFVQNNFNLTSGRTLRAEGSVTFRSPDCFRWDYTSTPQNILSSNGTTLFMILPDDRQALIQSVESTPELWSPVELLTQPDQLPNKFQVEQADSANKSLSAYRLLPKSPEKYFDYLLLTFDPKSKSADFSLTIFDLAGNRNMLEFSNYTALLTTPAFSPEIPSGFETLDFAGHPVLYRGSARKGELQK